MPDEASAPNSRSAAQRREVRAWTLQGWGTPASALKRCAVVTHVAGSALAFGCLRLVVLYSSHISQYRPLTRSSVVTPMARPLVSARRC